MGEREAPARAAFLSGTVVKRWKLLAVCNAVAADPTGQYVAAGGRDGVVRM